MVQNRKTKTRAVEPIVAALLLIAIAVAASVIMYTWVTNMISQQSQQAGTRISIETVQFLKTASNNTKISVTIRNTGSANAKIVTIYLTYPNSTLLATQYTTVVTPATTQPFDITLTTPNYWVASSSYTIKAVTDNGFLVEAAYTSPSS